MKSQKDTNKTTILLRDLKEPVEELYNHPDYIWRNRSEMLRSLIAAGIDRVYAQANCGLNSAIFQGAVADIQEFHEEKSVHRFYLLEITGQNGRENVIINPLTEATPPSTQHLWLWSVQRYVVAPTPNILIGSNIRAKGAMYDISNIPMIMMVNDLAKI